MVLGTLTRNPGRETFGGRAATAPLECSDPEKLGWSMEIASVLYNTDWIRFGYGRTTYQGRRLESIAEVRRKLARAKRVRSLHQLLMLGPWWKQPLGLFLRMNTTDLAVTPRWVRQRKAANGTGRLGAGPCPAAG